jgi:plastocyanin
MKKTLIYLAVLALMLPVTAFAGEVSGKAAFTGTAPAASPIDMNADPFCAGAHSEPVMTEEVVANSNGTLKNVFVYVKEGLPAGQTFPAPATPATLDQKGCHYTPHVFGLQVNQPLEIINSDSTLHNVHGMPKETKEFNLGMPIQGMKLKRTFEKPEVMVKFKCDVHPWMSAYAGVLNHPFFAVTGDDGSFKIADLPAGTYTVEAWHEKYGTQTASVTVAEGTPATADFTFAG